MHVSGHGASVQFHIWGVYGGVLASRLAVALPHCIVISFGCGRRPVGLQCPMGAFVASGRLVAIHSASLCCWFAKHMCVRREVWFCLDNLGKKQTFTKLV